MNSAIKLRSLGINLFSAGNLNALDAFGACHVLINA